MGVRENNMNSVRINHDVDTIAYRAANGQKEVKVELDLSGHVDIVKFHDNTLELTYQGNTYVLQLTDIDASGTLSNGGKGYKISLG